MKDAFAHRATERRIGGSDDCDIEVDVAQGGRDFGDGIAAKGRIDFLEDLGPRGKSRCDTPDAGFCLGDRQIAAFRGDCLNRAAIRLLAINLDTDRIAHGSEGHCGVAGTCEVIGKDG
jgi:hypothetical protein